MCASMSKPIFCSVIIYGSRKIVITMTFSMLKPLSFSIDTFIGRKIIIAMELTILITTSGNYVPATAESSILPFFVPINEFNSRKIIVTMTFPLSKPILCPIITLNCSKSKAGISFADLGKIVTAMNLAVPIPIFISIYFFKRGSIYVVELIPYHKYSNNVSIRWRIIFDTSRKMSLNVFLITLIQTPSTNFRY